MTRRRNFSDQGFLNHEHECFFASEVKTWLDGELAPTRAREVAQHVAECSRCRGLADDSREIAIRVQTAEPARPRFDVVAVCARAKNVRREEDGAVRLLKVLAGVAAVLIAVTFVFAWQERESENSAFPAAHAVLPGDAARFDPEFDVANRGSEAPTVVPTSTDSAGGE